MVFNKLRSYFPFRPRIMTKPGLSLPLKTGIGKTPGPERFEDQVSGCATIAPDRYRLDAFYGPRL